MAFIDGSNPPPSKTTKNTTTPTTEIPNRAYEAWFQPDQMLLSWLLSSLTEEAFTYIIGLGSFQVV
ncbi:conserved hypothetical protein [Ricinus communis]|uniref:Uncharacterized protein n=1 Tax=Ricinus communis TaxID=3988 RepID=B9S092_RICCO|nr:conserved hypothetical protein [Ricinus communis]